MHSNVELEIVFVIVTTGVVHQLCTTANCVTSLGYVPQFKPLILGVKMLHIHMDNSHPISHPIHVRVYPRRPVRSCNTHILSCILIIIIIIWYGTLAEERVTKSGGANLLAKQYLYCKNYNSMEHSEIRWGCSPIAPPFPPPMVRNITMATKTECT